MNTLTQATRAARRLDLHKALWGSAIAVAAVGLIYLGWRFGTPYLARLRAKEAVEAKTEPPPAPAAAEAALNTVVLPKEKLAAAGIELGEVVRAMVNTDLGVPGKIEANPARRLDVRPRVSSIVREVHVRPGAVVKAGDRLITLESAEIAFARLNVTAKLREYAVKRFDFEWKDQVARNVEELVPLLRKDVPASTILKDFAAKPLGSDRALLMSAYSDLEVATHEELKQNSFFKDTIIGEHPMLLARHARESAQAKFESALEQVRQDARLEKRTAEQLLELAKAGVIDAAQRLRLLGVADPLPDLEKLNDVSSLPASGAATDALSQYELLAPFDGTIMNVTAVYSQRAEPTESLLLLTDLSKVWVSASIPESSFGLLTTLRDARVKLKAQAYPGKTFEAKVLYTSGDVDPTTRAVRLVAELDNPLTNFRVGMYAWIELGSSGTRSALVIPAAAVQEIDGKSGVFVPDSAERSFTFRKIELGADAGKTKVVDAGLEEGAKIVVKGAFALKSELILQNQPEEE